MHDATPAGERVAARALAYWQNIDTALSATQTTQNRGRAYLLTRALARLTAAILAGLTILATTYVSALILLLAFAG